jgi:hypothetical protein
MERFKPFQLQKMVVFLGMESVKPFQPPKMVVIIGI